MIGTSNLSAQFLQFYVNLLLFQYKSLNKLKNKKAKILGLHKLNTQGYTSTRLSNYMTRTHSKNMSLNLLCFVVLPSKI